MPEIPLRNYAGWLVVAVLMMAVFGTLAGAAAAVTGPDAPMYALYLWTYFSSILAHAAFLGLPASAGWGALAMSVVALPLAFRTTTHRVRA